MTKTTCIRRAAWVIAWDKGAARHTYIRDADVAFADGRIAHVGPGYKGKADAEIDGRDVCVMPGLVDCHSHISGQPLYKGIREEFGNPHLYGSALYDYSNLLIPDLEGKKAAAETALCELLKSGVTTVLDFATPYEGWIETLAKSGIRACLAAGFVSAAWRLKDGREIYYEWDEAGGKRGFERAIATIEAAERHNSGRLFGMVAPGEIDTCTEELLRDAHAFARKTGRPFQTHIAESVSQSVEMTRRHGKTSVEWARDIGIVGPGTSFAHAIFLDHHSMIHWPSRSDVDVLADTGTAVAHCPTVFSRYGQTLESLGDYLRKGITVGIGTDTFPQNMGEEMRTANILARVAGRNLKAITTAEVFHAGTVGSATVLGRDDIGRLAPGMRADIVLLDLTHPMMQPARDPLRSFFYAAADRAVRDVFVDGQAVVSGGRVLTIDPADAARRLTAAQARMAAAVPSRDPAGRTLDEVSPLSLPKG
ncbi:MAG: N-ethylammeline chlorohydrolase [Rhodospirillales bacterium]|nr:N-ethylammeline chlorohydrolase [Rhodospirillales bacterium]